MRGKNRGRESVLLLLVIVIGLFTTPTFSDEASRAMLQRLGIKCDASEVHRRVERGDKKVVRLLLKAGISPDSPMNLGVTPLMIAVEKGFKDVIQVLLEFGAHLELREQLWSHTALMRAAQTGQISVMQQLIKAGANINAKTEKRIHFGTTYPGGDTVLILAVRKKQIEAIKELIKAGADINFVNDEGETALTVATKQGDQPLVSILTDRMKAKSQLVEKP